MTREDHPPVPASSDFEFLLRPVVTRTSHSPLHRVELGRHVLLLRDWELTELGIWNLELPG